MTALIPLAAQLRNLRIILKSGDYDGADLMRAWCAMAQAADALDSLREALIQADLKIRSFPGADQSDVDFIRIALEEIGGA